MSNGTQVMGNSKKYLEKLLLRDPSYNKLLTPIPETGSQGKTLLMVNMSITIVDIVDINELAKKFTIKFTYTRDWFDNRLTYMNLKVTLIKLSESGSILCRIPLLILMI